MTTERMQRTYELFEQALERPPEQRSAFLIEACGDDAKLRTEVESLLEHDGQVSDGFMRPPEHDLGVTVPARPGQAAQPPGASAAPRPPGPLIEGYEIIKELHRGGQGAVYQAIQKSTKRTVALKLLLQGPYASPRQRHRFEREIDLVAGLQHPHIVTVYDSGVTGDDRHYFAMEYIHGQSLNVYLSDKDLSIDETLRLFQKICAAVNYAHQRGVIHRDLKPGNIRIDANGEPHILDFGLAKAAGTGLTDGLPVSLTGEFMGTLAYASPEQTKGDPNLIDIRTDVYSLGVILYEMLTGEYPYPVVGQMAEVLRNIAEAEPMKPSTIRRQINDEVETIVLKALAKEKERRYQSAENLARDIEHYLGGEPIDAKRDSTWYVIRKSLRRYRAAVAVTAAFAVLLTGSLVATSILWTRAEHALAEAQETRQAAERAQQEEHLQREAADAARLAADIARREEETQRKLAEANAARAEEEANRTKEEAAKATQIQEFLQDMLASADPNKAKGANITVREVLEEAAQRIGTELGDHPAVEAAVRHTIGLTYMHLGRNRQAKEQLEIAVRLRRDPETGDEVELATSLRELAWPVYWADQDVARSRSLFEEALAIRERRLGKEHPLTVELLTDLANIEDIAGDKSSYLDLVAETLRRAIGTASSGEEILADLEQRLDRLSLLWKEGKREEALGNVRAWAQPYIDSGMATRDIVYGLTHFSNQRQSAGDYDAAEPLLREAVRIAREAEEPVHIATALQRLGLLLHHKRAYAEAATCLTEALELTAELYGNDHVYTLRAIGRMGQLCEARGKPGEAQEYYREALEGSRRALGDDHPETLTSIYDMGALLYSMGKLAEAEPYYREVLMRCRRVKGEDHPETLASISNMGHLLWSMGKLAEAEPYVREVLEGCRRVKGDDHPETLTSISNMGRLLWSMGKLAEAEPYYREALARYRNLHGDDHTDTLTAMYSMGRILRHLGRLEEAEALCAEAVNGFRRSPPEAPWLIGVYLSEHGKCLTNLERYADAEAALLESQGILETARGGGRRIDAGVPKALADLYDAWHEAKPDKGHDAKAAEWRARIPPAEKAVSLIRRGMKLLEQGEHSQAEPLLRQCLEIRQEVLPEDHWLIFNTKSVLGEALTGQAKFDEAEPLLLNSYAKLEANQQAIPAQAREVRLREALDRIVKLYESWGKREQAATWRAKLEQ